MKFFKLVFWVTVFFNFVLANENEFLKIPCAEFKKGASWRIHLGNFNSDMTSVIKSADKNRIVLTEMVEVNRGGLRGTASFTTILKKEGDTVYKESTKSNTIRVKKNAVYIPPMPICGKVPKKFSYTVLEKISGEKMKYRVKVKKIGTKKVRVRAGEFNATIYQKFIQMDTIGIRTGIHVRIKINSLEYYANKIGLIKAKSTITSIIPKHPSKAVYINELVSYKIPSK